jgi:hypothetical protein
VMMIYMYKVFSKMEKLVPKLYSSLWWSWLVQDNTICRRQPLFNWFQKFAHHTPPHLWMKIIFPSGLITSANKCPKCVCGSSTMIASSRIQFIYHMGRSEERSWKRRLKVKLKFCGCEQMMQSHKVKESELAILYRWVTLPVVRNLMWGRNEELSFKPRL